MRNIDLNELTQKIKEACISANKVLPTSLEEKIRSARDNETDELPKSVMKSLADNLDSAAKLNLPICQDTGMAVIFAEIGQDVHFIGGNFEDAVNKGVALGYTEGLLRKSIVSDPLRRVNTNDNTPAVIHTQITPGNRVKITVAPKGFGSENMSRLKMFTPSASREDIINFAVETAITADSNPCPPIVLGIGIGGDFEKCAILSKKALCRDISVKNPDEYYSSMEEDILKAVNETGIGPQGFGGVTTALAVAIETYPTHIAGLPVAVNVGCHVTRHFTFIL